MGLGLQQDVQVHASADHLMRCLHETVGQREMGKRDFK